MEKVAYTIDKFWDFPEDGNYHEIIDGEHVVSKAPSAKHQAISSNLLRQIFKYLADDLVFHAPTGLFLDNENASVPDIMVIRAENREIVRENGVHGPPDWIVEIMSPGNPRKDMIDLRDVFHRHNVPEYWVIDPDLERIYRFRQPNYQEEIFRLENVEQITCEVFDIEIDLGKLFNTRFKL